ncbi:MAG: hypothetical protein AAGD13_24710 [Pseudomonadota bacterium]
MIDAAAESACCFCGATLALTEIHHVRHAEIQGVLPFAIEEGAAKHAIQEQLSGIFGLPDALRRLADVPPRLTGVFVPGFTFDAEL